MRRILSRIAVGIGFSLLPLIMGCTSVQDAYESKVAHEFTKQPLRSPVILMPADIEHMPEPVRRYLAYTGSLGKPVPQNMRIAFDAKMWRKPGGKPLAASSEQHNFFGNPARLFFMKASQFLIPFRVLHAYTDRTASMQVRVAGLFNAVDLRGEELTRAETVTLLNDLCAFAPGALSDPRFEWESVDTISSRVFFTNGMQRVSAMLFFNQQGELVNFVSDDRSALQDDGTLKRVRWSTPLRAYRDFGGRKVPTYGEAIYHYPDGEFKYGSFFLRAIRFDAERFEK